MARNGRDGYVAPRPESHDGSGRTRRKGCDGSRRGIGQRGTHRRLDTGRTLHCTRVRP